MSTRSSSLNAYTTTSISREIDSKYDLIKTVADKIDDVETVAGMDLSGTASAIEALNDELQAIKDSGVATGAAGVDGIDGISAYEVAVNNGYTGTEVEWLASLKGAKGNDGIGYAGKSAYTIAVDNGFVGTQTE